MIYTCIYRGYAREGSEAWKLIIFPYPITVAIVEGKRLLIYVVSSNASNLMMCFKRNFDIRSQVQYNLVACMHAWGMPLHFLLVHVIPYQSLWQYQQK